MKLIPKARKTWEAAAASARRQYLRERKTLPIADKAEPDGVWLDEMAQEFLATVDKFLKAPSIPRKKP